jgi:hypothetical protein
MTKHLIIQKDDINLFKAELDRLNKVNNVFATQTHITVLREKYLHEYENGDKEEGISEKLIYTAILFCKD